MRLTHIKKREGMKDKAKEKFIKYVREVKVC